MRNLKRIKSTGYLLLVLIVFMMIIAACHFGSKKELSEQEKREYIKKGNIIAKESFKALSGELKAAMQRGGVAEAIQYCNLKANPITDSLSTVYNASVKRTSLKLRNSDNEANAIEGKLLGIYQKQFKNGDTLKPKITDIGEDKILFTAPIFIQPLCLNCHGFPGEQILDSNFHLIKQFYPYDKAIGYKTGDLRGMWSIEFEKQ